MKMTEKDDPNTWIFEQDISQMILDNYNKKRNKIWKFGTIILLFLTLLCLHFFSDYYGSVEKAGKIVISAEIIILLIEYLTIWILKKRIIKKYWPIIVIPIIALAIVVMVINIYAEGNVLLQHADILAFCGDYLAFLGTFCLGYFIYVQDYTKRIEEKRAKVRLLIFLVENANMEFLRLKQLVRAEKYNINTESRNHIKPIQYDSNWIVYYYEYESLKGQNSDLKQTLNSFFNNIIRVNTALMNGQIETAIEIHDKYVYCGNYSISKYNDSEALICLQDACSDYHILNTKSWIERKETIDLINELCRKYYFIIENYVYVWLIKHNVNITTERDNLHHEIVDWLLANSPELKEKFKFSQDKRIISKVVFDCSLKFSSNSKKINYVWGEYFLK